MADLATRLADVVGAEHVLDGDAAGDDYAHDEALTATPQAPALVVRPVTTAEVAAVLGLANDERVPVTARGSATGLSGAAIPRPGGLVVSFERMHDILEIDLENYVAVVQPGVTLEQLDETLASYGLSFIQRQVSELI